MSTPRLEIDLDQIRDNVAVLVDRLAARGIGVTGVTKATMGSPSVARAFLAAGVTALGDSRIENIERMRAAGIDATMVLVRSPMLSQCDRVVAHADISLNTELDVLRALSDAAGRAGRTHQVVLMVELGDLREGIMPGNVPAVAARVTELPHLALAGLGANQACQSGSTPDAESMAELGALTTAIESHLGVRLPIVSGGNSANLGWALGPGPVGRVNTLRLGESLLLGRDPLDRSPIAGLHTAACALVAEVIECKEKPSRPWGRIGEAAFGPAPPAHDRGPTTRVILAVGHQDVDPAGLIPPAGFAVLGASSDHLVLECGGPPPPIGAELRFGLDYAALLAATTSPFVAEVFLTGTDDPAGAGLTGRTRG